MTTDVKIEKDAAVVQEIRKYILNESQLRSEIESVRFRKNDLICQSQQIKKQFDELSEKENALMTALQELVGDVDLVILKGDNK